MKLTMFSFIKALSASTIFASPLKDISTTSIDLSENQLNTKGDETLFVTVTRVDDLIDDDGSLLAERVMAVRVTFEVFENQLMCNGHPVEIGVSNIQVEAQMASNPEKLTITSEEDAAILADSFDVGLVTVEVTATLLDELKTDDGMTFRRLGVKELITEINGLKVVQTEAAQQILDVFDNGSLTKWAVDPLTGFMLPAEDENTPTITFVDDSFSDRAFGWWDRQSTLTQGLLAGIACGFTSLSFIFVVAHTILKRRRASQYMAVHEQEEEEIKEQPPAYVEQGKTMTEEHEEKKPFLA
ncbi:hypothetical protein G6F57_009987 [Rhizopus arrhizus]|uniref:Uncharacterized protein n=1 Tax=Rhizopus oryzae TaxID=64495 RepID=A0A9P6X254_RHIOR|nr:hypothetical protein G6F30_007478 [Rhizopus arrhizus]KAG1393412.1 hypothetical protein G6F58_012320 [Rhizopus delemar]KAG0978697.1 hypothetical protein G6F29_009130 [Rhizopus arrhizus]KAG0986185.1 hypothetical protein G6F28_010309 [Rhizopus arrhizus]KAG1005213.1 hypothetical protein G6F27_009429 [Rhizopus arrhizus]